MGRKKRSINAFEDIVNFRMPQKEIETNERRPSRKRKNKNISSFRVPKIIRHKKPSKFDENYYDEKRVKGGFRVVGGSPTSVHEFPWLGLLIFSGFPDNYCSVTLINSKFVLTAAHCVSE